MSDTPIAQQIDTAAETASDKAITALLDVIEGLTKQALPPGYAILVVAGEQAAARALSVALHKEIPVLEQKAEQLAPVVADQVAGWIREKLGGPKNTPLFRLFLCFSQAELVQAFKLACTVGDDAERGPWGWTRAQFQHHRDDLARLIEWRETHGMPGVLAETQGAVAA